MTEILSSVERINPPIRFVYFDLGGVVFSFSGGLEAIANKVGRSLEDITAYWRSQDDAICRGELQPQQFWNNLASQFHYNGANFDFLDFWISHFQPIQQTHDAMRALQSDGTQIGILTNIYPGVFERAIDTGAIPDLEYQVVVKSCELGIVKPDLQIFRHALTQTNFGPGEVLFIDDRVENTQVAKKLKWNGILFEKN